MHAEIAGRFENLETRRKALVERVRALSAQKQIAKPGGKGFSPTNVIMHMALAERGNVVFMEKAPPATLKGKKPHVRGFFKMTVAKMRNPVKPLATVPYMVPKSQVSLDEADRAWQDVRKTTVGYFEQVELPGDPMVKFLFFFGLSSASDYRDLLEAHTSYHEQRFPSV